MAKRVILKNTGTPGVAPVGSNLTQSVGFGYVYMPQNVQREDYIKTCFRSMRIDIVDDLSGQYIRNCFVTNEALNNILFPDEVGSIGQPVVWVAQPFRNAPLIIGTFMSGEHMEFREENSFKFTRTFGSNLVKIEGDAPNNQLTISVQSKNDAVIDVNVTGEDSMVQVNSEGSVKVSANNNIEAVAYGDLIAKVIDSDPDYANESFFAINRDEILLASSYGMKDKTHFSVSINESGIGLNANFVDETVLDSKITKETIGTEVAIGESNYKSEVTGEHVLTEYQNASLELKENMAKLKQGEGELVIENDKVAFVNNNVGLKDILEQIKETIQGLTVSTSMGPSGTPLPPTLMKLQELDMQLNNFFNK